MTISSDNHKPNDRIAAERNHLGSHQPPPVSEAMLARVREVFRHGGVHAFPSPPTAPAVWHRFGPRAITWQLYLPDDLAMLHEAAVIPAGANPAKSVDDLLQRDKLRERDGFPRKIRLGKMIRPGRGGKDKIVVVPTATEEKFYHDNRPPADDEEGQPGGSAGGAGDGEEGEVIGEEPIHAPGGTGAGGVGSGEGGDHEVGSDAYELGRILTEQLKLPNLKDKGKKRSLTRYSYELTDKHRGEGQVLDKKATLKRILKTNIALGRVRDGEPVDPLDLLVHKRDRVYRVLSRERDLESQAVVLFVRDYSGSMQGRPTEIVVSQHVMIYSWLVYQYQSQVISRFFVHDTDAREVPDFYTYSHVTVAGGTKIHSALKMINQVVDQEDLIRDNNIYVFYGGDGDDWDSDGKLWLGELEKMLRYVNRFGMAVAKHSSHTTNLERHLRGSGLLDAFKKELRLDVMTTDADEERIIASIKSLIS